MKITKSQLRQIIKEEILKEAGRPYSLIYRDDGGESGVVDIYADSDDEAVEKMVSSTVIQDDYLIIDKGLDKLDYKLGKCCSPIYGDEIFGFVTVSSGITIHRVSCPNAAQLISRHGYRVVKAQWALTGSEIYLPVSIRVTGVDDVGILSKISDIISKDLRVNMRSVTIDSTDGMFEGTITLFVKDTSHLEGLIKRLGNIKGVLNVSRMGV